MFTKFHRKSPKKLFCKYFRYKFKYFKYRTNFFLKDELFPSQEKILVKMGIIYRKSYNMISHIRCIQNNYCTPCSIESLRLEQQLSAILSQLGFLIVVNFLYVEWIQGYSHFGTWFEINLKPDFSGKHCNTRISVQPVFLEERIFHHLENN